MRKLINFYAKPPSCYHDLEWFGIFYTLVNFRMISEELFVEKKKNSN